VKLSAFVPFLAEVTGVPAKSVNVVTMHLRKAGLITTGGRGRGGAELQTRDATNTLLALMGSQQAKGAATAVRGLRELPLTLIIDGDELVWTCPDPQTESVFPQLDVGLLGSCLDSLFDQFARGETLINKRSGRRVEGGNLEVREVGPLRDDAKLSLRHGNTFCALIYERVDPAFTYATELEADRMRERASRIVRWASVSWTILRRIGAGLGGRSAVGAGKEGRE
jgi:hypothetical protein